jgi:predicted RND superfamily exporter protein
LPEPVPEPAVLPEDAPRPPAGEPPPGLAFPDRLCRVLVPWLVARRRLVLILAAVATAVGTYFSVRLYSDLRSNVEELLPSDAPSVIAARTLGPKLHTVTQLAVVLEGNDGDAIARLADAIAERVRLLPHDLVESIDYRIDQQVGFLKRFGSLYLSVEDIRTIQARLDARIAWEKRNANPLLHLLDDEEETEPPPPLDFSDLEKKYGAPASLVDQFRNGYFQTPDGRLLVLLIRPPQAASGYDNNKRLLDRVRAEIEALQPRTYDPSVVVGFDGEVTDFVEEQEALVKDLASSTVVVLLLTLTVLWIFFRRWTAILSIAGALAVGCALTFGLAWFLVGHLNANTAFLGSIVVGNGINVSIIVTARFLEARRRGVPMDPAIRTAWRDTFAATFVAAFAAGLSYLSLSVTGFRGFNQFGIIGGLGMAMCWVTAYLLLPPLLVALDSRSKRKAPPPHRPVMGNLVCAILSRGARPTLVISALLSIGAVVAIASYRDDPIEYDLSKLRTAESERSGSMFWGKKVDIVFRAYLTPILVWARTPEELQKVVAAIDARRRDLGNDDPIREIRDLQTVVPPNQQEKLPLLQRLRETLSDSRLKLLDPEVRRKAEMLRPPADLRTFTIADVPRQVALPLTERDGTVGRVALVFPRTVGSLESRTLRQMTELIRGSIQSVGADAHAVGQSLLFDDIATAIWRDGPKATVVALVLVCLLVALVFRRFGTSSEVIGALLLGILWVVGAAAAARVKVNFLNFVALPITFGIGADYAVNIVQRHNLDGPGSLGRVLRETGGAVALCSMTTVIGYASLLVADNRALSGFGLLASLGELACLLAALLTLPAYLLVRSGAERLDP